MPNQSQLTVDPSLTASQRFNELLEYFFLSKDSDAMEQPLIDAIRQSSKFWFQDGNIVLQAERTQFRVHRSILSLQSEVMKDMFAVAKPGIGPQVDECPIVLLSDTAQDIENLCALLYGFYKFSSPTIIDSSYLQTMVRLGRKYDIPHIMKTALDQLRHLFPKEMYDYDKSSDIVHTHCYKNKSFLFDIINLAYECHIPSILPAAFLHMCGIYRCSEILTGTSDCRWGEKTHYGTLESQALLDCICGRMLVTQSFYKCLLYILDNGIEESMIPERADRLHTISNSLYAIPCEDCKDKSLCSIRFSNMLGRMVGTTAESEKVSFPSGRNGSGVLCEECALVYDAAYEKSLEETWQRLPYYFNLPDWNEMIDFDQGSA